MCTTKFKVYVQSGDEKFEFQMTYGQQHALMELYDERVLNKQLTRRVSTAYLEGLTKRISGCHPMLAGTVHVCECMTTVPWSVHDSLAKDSTMCAQYHQMACRKRSKHTVDGIIPDGKFEICTVASDNSDVTLTEFGTILAESMRNGTTKRTVHYLTI